MMGDLEQRATTELEAQKALQAQAVTRIEECDKNLGAWNQSKAEAIAVAQQCNGASSATVNWLAIGPA